MPGVVFDHGTHYTDDQVTWETLDPPTVEDRATRTEPRYNNAPAAAASAGHARLVNRNKTRTAGRPHARGTEASVDGGRESEGCIRAMTAAKASGDAEPAEQRRPVLM